MIKFTDEINIGDISRNLEMREPDLWFSKKLGPISYPEDGNSNCFEFENESFWFKHRNNCIIAMVRTFPPTGIILDIGGGNGIVSLALQEAGFKTILIEPGNQKRTGVFRRRWRHSPDR